jgi:hypothetical protein
MVDVHLFFLKLTGCMIAEAKANGHDVPISLDPFSEAIMSGRPHAEVHLQFGRHDGGIGRSDLHVWKTDPRGSILGGWLYQLDTIAVSVVYARPAGSNTGGIYGILIPGRAGSGFRSPISCTGGAMKPNLPTRLADRQRLRRRPSRSVSAERIRSGRNPDLP